MNERISVVIALGMFDGVHIGHKALLEKSASLAKEFNSMPIAYSFSNHPMTVFGRQVELLTTNDEKIKLIEQLGVTPILIEFDHSIADMPAMNFLERLKSQFEICGIVCGFNYHFGAKAKGDGALISEIGAREGYKSVIVEPVEIDGQIVSSTKIRAAIKNGNIIEANRMLGYSYSITGEVFSNKQLGTRLGYPTANIVCGEKVVPKFGVYATRVTVGSLEFEGVTNVGVRPTVNQDNKIMIETYLLNCNKNLYGQNITVRFEHFIREEKKYDSLDKLKQAINEDCKKVGKLLGQS